jgi:regulatory protein
MLQGLRIGQEFDAKTFAEIKDTAEEDKAYMRALDLLARRPRSKWEMEQYLKRKDYDNSVITKLLNRLSNGELLDDKKFAESWVLSRRLLKNMSKRRLLQELQQKKISEQIISEVLEADETDELDVLKEIIQKKQTQTRYQDKQKLIAYLLRQGFSFSDVKSVLGNEQ